MATLKKTRLAVATGILMCLIGLGFIATSGTSAMSSGYGTSLELSSIGSSLLSPSSGECVALKGTHACQSENSFIF